MKYSISAIIMCAIYLGIVTQLPFLSANAKPGHDEIRSMHLIIPIPQQPVIPQMPPIHIDGAKDPETRSDISNQNQPTPLPTEAPPILLQNQDETYITTTPTPLPSQNTSIATQQPPVGSTAPQQNTQTQPNTSNTSNNTTTTTTPPSQTANTQSNQNIIPQQQTQIISPIPQKDMFAKPTTNTQPHNNAEVYNPLQTIKHDVEKVDTPLQKIPLLADETTYQFYEYLGIMDGWDRIILMVGLSFTAVGMVFIHPRFYLDVLNGVKQKSKSILAPYPEDYFYIPKISLPTS